MFDMMKTPPCPTLSRSKSGQKLSSSVCATAVILQIVVHMNLVCVISSLRRENLVPFITRGTVAYDTATAHEG